MNEFLENFILFILIKENDCINYWIEYFIKKIFMFDFRICFVFIILIKYEM